MSKHCICVQAPSRLHLGLLSFGDPSVRQFGGVGIMVETPGLELTISAAEQLTVDGLHRQRVQQLALRWARFHTRVNQPACHLQVLSAPRQHIGLGTGTQLAMTVATGLNTYFEIPEVSLTDLARSVGRGRRSSIGTYGFRHGGLVAELGKTGDQTLAPLERQITLPAAWRFVLLLPTERVGLSGKEENQAFDAMPPVPRQITQQLTREMLDCLLPAAEQGDFTRFGESIYRYGLTAGRCFAQRQAGAFATEQLAQRIQTMRQLGVCGVGQSSWGPTLFALLPSESDAHQFVRDLRRQIESNDLHLTITRIRNDGASIIKGSGA